MRPAASGKPAQPEMSADLRDDRFWCSKVGLLSSPPRLLVLASDGIRVFDKDNNAVKTVAYEGVLTVSERKSDLETAVPGFLRVALTRGGSLKFRFSDVDNSYRFMAAFKRWVCVPCDCGGAGAGRGRVSVGSVCSCCHRRLTDWCGNGCCCSHRERARDSLDWRTFAVSKLSRSRWVLVAQ